MVNTRGAFRTQSNFYDEAFFLSSEHYRKFLSWHFQIKVIDFYKFFFND